MKAVLKVKINTIVNEIAIEENQTITIGRKSEDYKVPDPLVSGNHCKFLLSASRLQVTDLESKNGTYLNGVRIDQAEMFIGDEISIGSTKISFFKEKMDADSLKFLAFPGDPKDRASYGLRLNYSNKQGPDSLNLTVNSKPTRPSVLSKEPQPQNKFNGKIKFSRQEIRRRNPVRATFASTLNVLFLILIMAIPLIATNLFLILELDILKTNRLLFILALETMLVGGFYFINFKLMKFSLGERFAGLQDLYENQDQE